MHLKRDVHVVMRARSITAEGGAIKKQAAGFTRAEVKALLDSLCTSIKNMSIDKMSSLPWSHLKFLAVGVNCILRCSSEHHNLML